MRPYADLSEAEPAANIGRKERPDVRGAFLERGGGRTRVPEVQDLILVAQRRRLFFRQSGLPAVGHTEARAGTRRTARSATGSQPIDPI